MASFSSRVSSDDEDNDDFVAAASAVAVAVAAAAAAASACLLLSFLARRKNPNLASAVKKRVVVDRRSTESFKFMFSNFNLRLIDVS